MTSFQTCFSSTATICYFIEFEMDFEMNLSKGTSRHDMMVTMFMIVQDDC